MSAPRELSCRETADKLYEFIDGELTPDIEDLVRVHLADCIKCTKRHDFENVFLRFIHARTHARAAPAHLKKRVFESILCEEDQPGSD